MRSGAGRVSTTGAGTSVWGVPDSLGYLLSIFFDIIVEGAEGVETHGIV